MHFVGVGSHRVILRYIKLLQDDGNYYQDLMKACKDKLLEISPKDYYQLFPRPATTNEIDEATQESLH